MNALAELKIDCQLRKIPGYYANCPECAKFLDEIIIPEGVEIIGESAFYDCNNVTVIDIPDSVREIDEDAFLMNNIDKTITVPERFKDKLNDIGLSANVNRVTFI